MSPPGHLPQQITDSLRPFRPGVDQQTADVDRGDHGAGRRERSVSRRANHVRAVVASFRSQRSRRASPRYAQSGYTQTYLERAHDLTVATAATHQPCRGGFGHDLAVHHACPTAERVPRPHRLRSRNARSDPVPADHSCHPRTASDHQDRQPCGDAFSSTSCRNRRCDCSRCTSCRPRADCRATVCHHNPAPRGRRCSLSR